METRPMRGRLKLTTPFVFPQKMRKQTEWSVEKL
jgi:hypothetical protein